MVVNSNLKALCGLHSCRQLPTPSDALKLIKYGRTLPVEKSDETMLEAVGHVCAFLARIVFALAVAVLVYVAVTAGKNLFKVKTTQLTKVLKINVIFRGFFKGLPTICFDDEHFFGKPVVSEQ